MGRRKGKSPQNKGRNARKVAKRKALSSSPTEVTPPKKTQKITIETNNNLPGATSTPQVTSSDTSASRKRGTDSTSSPANSSTSHATSINSSLMASSISQIEPLPSPTEIVAMTSASPSKSDHELNLQPLLNNLLQSDLSKISDEGRVIVQSLTKIFNFGLLATTTKYDDCIRLKDIQIAVLTQKNSELQERLSKLEARVDAHESDIKDLHSKTDENDQYERRDTIILSGEELPDEDLGEEPDKVVVATLNRVLGLKTSTSDINVAHRLGRKHRRTSDQEREHKRPMIVKLQSRMLKSAIVKKCTTVKAKLYVNESLTPVRRAIFKRFLAIRWKHRGLFSQLYTNDGNIIVKLKDEQEKHLISNDSSLQHFLRNYPVLFGAYNSEP